MEVYRAITPAILLLASASAIGSTTLQYRCLDGAEACYTQQVTVGPSTQVRPHSNGRLQESLSNEVIAANLWPDGTQLARTHFTFDRAELSDTARTILTSAAPKMRISNQQFVIEGHTDNYGKEPYNQTLGQQRAEHVAQFLQDQGVASKQLTVRSMGEADPVEDNRKDAGRAENRRVDIIVRTQP